MIDADTRLCAVIGHPVGHSLSPAIHNAAFRALGLNYVYLAFDVTDVAGCLAGMRALPSFRGMSVTIPHKRAVIPHLDSIDSMAENVGSVNTITHEDGSLKGSTTDGPGTLRAFAEAGIPLAGKRVLFFGSGGAVRAVAFAMINLERVNHVTILGRTPENVDHLVTDLRAKTAGAVEGGSLDSAADIMANHDVLIQGTPTGMEGALEQESCVPAEALESRHAVMDMVYRPARTRLIADAESAGCSVIYGREMLIFQAALQFELWTGMPAPVEVMRTAFEEALMQSPR